MHCRVCNAQANHFARAKILSKYEIEYFRCCDCQFIQTEEPYWIEEAYNHAIIRSDVGLVSRNLKLARITSRVLNVLFPKAKSCIDYGGGFGLLTRLMRDLGHNFSHYDPMAENLFAQGFQASDKDRFDLLTAFEVWEHLAEPIEQIRLMDQLADNWLISTLLVPEPPPNQMNGGTTFLKVGNTFHCGVNGQCMPSHQDSNESLSRRIEGFISSVANASTRF